MKTKSILLCGSLVLSSFLNGMPSQLKKEVQKAQASLSKLSIDLSTQKIDEVKEVLKKTCAHLQQEYKKINIATDSSYDDAPKHIRCLKTDISFIEDLNEYIKTHDEEYAQKLKSWAASNYKFASLVDKALSNTR